MITLKKESALLIVIIILLWSIAMSGSIAAWVLSNKYDNADIVLKEYIVLKEHYINLLKDMECLESPSKHSKLN